jgi:hypothetical protein
VTTHQSLQCKPKLTPSRNKLFQNKIWHLLHCHRHHHRGHQVHREEIEIAIEAVATNVSFPTGQRNSKSKHAKLMAPLTCIVVNAPATVVGTRPTSPINMSKDMLVKTKEALPEQTYHGSNRLPTPQSSRTFRTVFE